MMTTNDYFYKAYSLIEPYFPSKKAPVMEWYIEEIAQKDARKADFLRLLTMEMVPDDLRADGDYNTPRVEEAVKRLDIKSLAEIEDGSGDFMLGVLYARGILCFGIRNEAYKKSHLYEGIQFFEQAKAKGCPAAEAEINYYKRWVK